jgi:hypothetical protein
MFLLLLVTASLSWATQPLDSGYRNLAHPEYDLELMSTESLGVPPKSDIHAMMQRQTSVKSQQNRGTCSIFSATALVETLLVVNGRAGNNLDLSEEWLQYLTTLKIAEEGSTSPDNFKLLRKYGQPVEARMPYVGTEWKTKEEGLAAKRCGHLPRGKALRACLISHRDPNLMRMSDAQLLNPISHLYDPEFVTARAEALINAGTFFTGSAEDDGIVRKVSEIHRILAEGTPLALDLYFYNGAWNYPGSHKVGIYRSEKLWKQGVVTYAEVGSVDRKYSATQDDGHSIVVVGYDDDREVEYWMSMEDGTRKKFKRKGVYYFKNSWGASTWGKNFEIDGKPYPGYGMILQVEAHSHGQFYHLNLN